MPAQSIIGATLNRREGSGRVVCGVKAVSKGILVYAFLYHLPGFEGVLGVTVVGCTTAKRARTTENRATIRARKKADGTVSDTVQICLEKNGALVYQEAQTFARKQAAQAWVKRRKTGLVECCL